MTVYNTLQQMIRILKQVDTQLDKLAAHADSKKIDSKILVESRLIADQIPYRKQIQIATDAAKGIASRLSRREPPVFEDNETTVPELKARVQKTIDYLKTAKDGEFQNYESVKVPISFLKGKYLNGDEYFEQMAVPNFYFHVTTAYSILRANGIPLGKNDFLGELNFKDL